MNAFALPDEPLIESAPLAYEFASQNCFQNYKDTSCIYYHGAWQYLRLLGVISGIVAETAFFQKQFKRVAQSKKKHRVLIAGSADYGMLAQVHAAYKSVDITPEISVIDCCITPLRLNEWYASRNNFKIKTYHSDVFEFGTDIPFDVVCTHSFFSFIDQEKYKQLMLKWNQLLAEQGSVITTQSIRPNNKAKKIIYTQEKMVSFVDKVRTGVNNYGNVPGISRSDLIDLAMSFAATKSAYVVRDIKDITDPLESSGFHLDILEKLSDNRTAQHFSANPDDNTKWQRYQLCAVKSS